MLWTAKHLKKCSKCFIPSAVAVGATMFVLTGLCSTSMAEPSIGGDCKPLGLFAKAKEALSPREFWSTQIGEIKKDIENTVASRRMARAYERGELAQARRESRLDRSIGVKQFSSKETDQLLADTDKYIQQLDRELMDRKLSWAKRCTAYAREQLRKAHK